MIAIEDQRVRNAAIAAVATRSRGTLLVHLADIERAHLIVFVIGERCSSFIHSDDVLELVGVDSIETFAEYEELAISQAARRELRDPVDTFLSPEVHA